MLGVFSAFERAMIVERVQAGLQRARAQGKQLGRPRIEAHLEAAIRAYRLDGMSMNRIAQTVGVGKGTVLRVLRSE
jgi:DNA invertase Pin-like site-specific DNA recombinase